MTNGRAIPRAAFGRRAPQDATVAAPCRLPSRSPTRSKRTSGRPCSPKSRAVAPDASLATQARLDHSGHLHAPIGEACRGGAVPVASFTPGRAQRPMHRIASVMRHGPPDHLDRSTAIDGTAMGHAAGPAQDRPAADIPRERLAERAVGRKERAPSVPGHAPADGIPSGSAFSDGGASTLARPLLPGGRTSPPASSAEAHRPPRPRRGRDAPMTMFSIESSQDVGTCRGQAARVNWG